MGNLYTGLANKIPQHPAKLNDVENALAPLSVVKAPYSGTVRRIR